MHPHFVVRYDNATLQEIKDALERVEKSGVQLLGCVVNGIKVSKKGVKNPVKERENIKKAEVKRNTIGDPLVNLDNPAGESGTNTPAEDDSLVAGFAAATVEEAAKEKREVTSGGEFVDFLFQEESNQDTDAKNKRK